MKVLEHTAGPALVDAHRAYFLTTEASNNLLLGVLLRTPEVAPEALLWSLEVNGALVGVALHTPPFHLLLSPMPDDALDALVAALVARGRSLAGVNGDEATVTAFSARWALAKGGHSAVLMRQGVFELTRLEAPEGVAGAMRLAAPDDRVLVEAWMRAFCVDCGLPEDEHAVLVAGVARSIAEARVCLWCVDGAPVSMAVRGGDTLTGARIGGVYTPPSQRGRGYASACTAAASRRCLDSGRRAVYLYTDLGNPTSNKIYQALGYRLVGVAMMMRLTA